MTTPHDLARRLRDADPLAGVLGDDRTAVLVRRLLSAAVLLCLAAGGPGLADRLSAWTGIHGSGVGEDTSEYLLSTAPDFRRAVESLRPAHLPLPPGYTWRRARVFQAVDRREPTSISATAIKDIHAMYAACTWEAEWLAGRRAGDTGRVRTATRVLAEARSWPDAGADKTGGARRARAEIAKAAANGDPGPLRVDLHAACRPGPAPRPDRPAA